MIGAATVAIALLGATLAACTRAPQQTVALPALDGGRGRMAWQGELPCADCDGIKTYLLLQREGERRGFRLIEIFALGDDGARFDDDGSWTREGDLIRTLGRDGSTRVYGLLAGGGLQPRDARGKSFARHDDALLLPVSRAAPR